MWLHWKIQPHTEDPNVIQMKNAKVISAQPTFENTSHDYVPQSQEEEPTQAPERNESPESIEKPTPAPLVGTSETAYVPNSDSTETVTASDSTAEPPDSSVGILPASYLPSANTGKPDPEPISLAQGVEPDQAPATELVSTDPAEHPQNIELSDSAPPRTIYSPIVLLDDDRKSPQHLVGIEGASQWPPPVPSPSLGTKRNEAKMMLARALRVSGSRDHPYEDAVAFDESTGFGAVADGMTVGCHPEILSEVMVSHFVQGSFHLEGPESTDWWKYCARIWTQRLLKLFPHMEAEEQDQYINFGAGATFIGLRLELVDGQPGYVLCGVGDCCALWFNNGAFITVEPEDISFNYHPQHLQVRNNNPLPNLLISRSNLKGDTLFLASDALAKYLLEHKPWVKNPSFTKDWWGFTEATFEQETRRLHSEGLLEDDDWTVLQLRFPWELQSKDVAPSTANGKDPHSSR
jgi:Protein phosphatase 2C